MALCIVLTALGAAALELYVRQLLFNFFWSIIF